MNVIGNDVARNDVARGQLVSARINETVIQICVSELLVLLVHLPAARDRIARRLDLNGGKMATVIIADKNVDTLGTRRREGG